jgi:hypothetical protein
MKRPILRTVVYLVCLSIGLALIVLGISWLCLFGCAMTLCAIQFAGRPSAHNSSNTLVNYLGLFAGFGGGVYQLAGAWRGGHLWFRVSPSWWFVLFVAAAWAACVVKEFSPSPPPGMGWQAAVRQWNVRRLKARLQTLPPEKREKFLAQFDRLDRKAMESYRREIRKDL